MASPSDEPGDLRVVLQTGASAWMPRIFAVAFTLGSLAAGLLVALLSLASLERPLNLAFALAPLGFVGVSIVAHVVIWRTRATDMLVGPAGIRFEGGPLGGVLVPWGDLDAARCRIEQDRDVVVKINDEVTYLHRLHVAWGGRDVVAATSTDRDEQASLAAVLEMLRTKHEIVEDVGPADVVRCPSCGSAVSPADRTDVACWRCGAAVVMPAGLRARLGAAAGVDALREDVQRRVRRLLDQPRAIVANAWFLASLLVWYPVLVMLCLVPGLWASWALLALALVSMSNLQVARRRAFHRLAVVFAARPAETPGAPLRCRSCAGPLPASAGVLVRCPWCSADNLRSLALERPASLWTEADQDVRKLADDQRARTAWPSFLVVASAAAAVGWAAWVALAA